MSRTSVASVKTLLRNGATDSDYDGTSDLSPYIDSANAVVSRVATCATSRGVTLSSTELELIERWLAAHFYAMSDQTIESKKTGERAAKFHGKTGMRFEATKYGQSAINIDVSGCLASMNRGGLSQVVWLGFPPSEQTDYDQRD